MNKEYDDLVIESAVHLFPDPKNTKKSIDFSFARLSSDTSQFSSTAHEAFSALFSQNDSRVTSIGNNLHLYLFGESPKTNVDYYKIMNGKRLDCVPGIILIDQAVAFANLYNYHPQDRSDRVTQISTVDFGKAVLPYLITYLCLRNPYSFSENSLSFQSGSMFLTFSAKRLNLLHGSDIPKVLVDSIYYQILVKDLKLVSEHDFSAAFCAPEFNMVRETISFTLSLVYTPQKTSLSANLDNRILSYLDTTGGSTRKQIADYFDISDRMMNYHLQSLVASGKIYRDGSLTSPKLLYKKTIQKKI